METNSQEKVFHLAITMAGAVSAGAYTAGVIDYLLEVLDRWKDLKKDPEFADKVPSHEIKIEILSGASAGGMTAAITSLALHRKKKHPICAFSSDETNSYDNDLDEEELKFRKKNNRLYNSWVNLTSSDMLAEMLKTDDEITLTTGEKSCVSALNSKFIKQLAQNTLSIKNREMPLELPEYVSKNLRTFVTLTNLDGFEKEVGFAGKGSYSPNFLMYDHRDLAFFRFNPLNGQPLDGSVEVNFNTGANTDLFIEAGIATGAFPIGLGYRTFSRKRESIEKNILLQEIHGKFILKNVDGDGKYRSTFMDGGLINNEPFELTEFLFEKQVPNARISTDHNKFNSLILMIDPFPSEKAEPTNYGTDPAKKPFSLLGIAGKLLSTLRTQVLVKPSLIRRAYNPDNYTSFIIAPRRRKFEESEDFAVDGSKAIACGSLGGFGGFIDKDFREHDFYLGRINCKSFLQKHFRVPADTNNEIFKHGYLSPETKKLFGIKGESGEIEFLPIIPDVNKLNPSDPKLEGLYRNLKFPRFTSEKFTKKFGNYKPAIKNRIKFLIKMNLGNSIVNWLASIGLFFFGGKIFASICKIIKSELEKWEIIKD